MKIAIVVLTGFILTNLVYADSTGIGARSNIQPNFVGVTMPSPSTSNNSWPSGSAVWCPWDPNTSGSQTTRAALLYNSYGNNPANACPDPATGRYLAYGSKTAAQVQSDSVTYNLCPDQCVTQRALVDNSTPPRTWSTGPSTASGIYEPTCLNNYAQLTLTSSYLSTGPNQYVARNTDITPQTPGEVIFYLNSAGNNTWNCAAGLANVGNFLTSCVLWRSPENVPINTPYFDAALNSTYVIRSSNLSGSGTCYYDANCWAGGGTAPCNGGMYIIRTYSRSAYTYCRCNGNYCITAKHVPDLVVCGMIKQGWKKVAP